MTPTDDYPSVHGTAEFIGNCIHDGKSTPPLEAPAEQETGFKDPRPCHKSRTPFTRSMPPGSHAESETESEISMSERQLLVREREGQLNDERMNSWPWRQLSIQVGLQGSRYEQDSLAGQLKLPFAADWGKAARELIIGRWREQGIWNEKWTEMGGDMWKHQEPLDLNSESDTSTDDESAPKSVFIPSRKRRRPRTAEEKERFRERRAVLKREREASRPYHQFLYQISEERERIGDELAIAEDSEPYDINTKAYGNIKYIWRGWGIWNEKWGVLPGMKWKHEEDLDLSDLEAPTPVLRAKVAGALHYKNADIQKEPTEGVVLQFNIHSYEQTESDAEPELEQALSPRSVLSQLQHDSTSYNSDATESEDDVPSPHSLPTKSPKVHKTTATQGGRPRTKATSRIKHGANVQEPPAANAPKATRKRTQSTVFVELPPQPSVEDTPDTPDTPDQTSPRRSKRLKGQQPSNTSKDPETEPPRATPKRKAANAV